MKNNTKTLHAMKNLEQTTYSSVLEKVKGLKEKYGNTWDAIAPRNAARMAIQNRFKTGIRYS